MICAHYFCYCHSDINNAWSFLLFIILWLSLLQLHYSIELDEKGFYALTSSNDKNGMVMFYHPWCGHCTAMKPDWDQLTEKFQSDPSVFISRINCSDFKNLCDDNAIHTFPKIRVYYYNDKIDKENSNNMQRHIEEDYRGGRSFEDMFDFVDSKLVKKCSINNDRYNSCSDKSINYINKWKVKSSRNIQNEIERLQTILNDNSLTSLEQRSWVRERQGILRQLFKYSGQSDEL